MKSSFFIYSNSIKKAPKGFMVFILLILIVLIPLILSLFLVGGVLKLIGKPFAFLLPSRKKSIVSNSETNTTIIDITPSNNSLN